MKILGSIISTFLIMASLVYAEPAKKSASDKNKKDPLEEQLGKEITLVGVAQNLKIGALLSGKNFSVWIDNMDGWPDNARDKNVSVTGTLIERHDLPVFIQKRGNRDIPSGISVPKGTDLHEAAHRYLLKDVKWVIVAEVAEGN